MESVRSSLNRGFTLVELLVTVALIGVLGTLLATAGLKAYQESSLAISANNLRQLSVGGINYLAENNNVYWRYLETSAAGRKWWFGLEPVESVTKPEGQRFFNSEEGPLGGYVPAGMRADPSFSMGGNAFKPKFKFGYLGIGYNVLLGGGWLSQKNPDGTYKTPCANNAALGVPGKVVVFFTSAQVNNFQAPASSRNPMVEEFYGIDEKEVTVHFRHHGYAMVTYADGSAGFLPMDPTTRDQRMPKANVGRFAPVGSTLYLQ